MRRKAATRKVRKPARRELLKIDDRAVEVSVRLNPRARRLIVKVHPSTGEVTVVAPSRTALASALQFARGQSDWIARQLSLVPAPVALVPGARVPLRGREHLILRAESGPVRVEEGVVPVIRVAGRAEHIPRRVLDFLKREARLAFEARVLEFSGALGLKARRIAVRDTSSRWGSCSSTRALSFSWRLILAPAFVFDYVVAHEVAHLGEMNHGPRFWRLVRALVGDFKRPQAWLGEHGAGLHRYGAGQVPPNRLSITC